MKSGVGKSGSPAPNPITGRPSALSALALASTASVADSAMAPMRREMRRVGTVAAADSVTDSMVPDLPYAVPWRPRCGRHGPRDRKKTRPRGRDHPHESGTMVGHHREFALGPVPRVCSPLGWLTTTMLTHARYHP